MSSGIFWGDVISFYDISPNFGHISPKTAHGGRVGEVFGEISSNLEIWSDVSEKCLKKQN